MNSIFAKLARSSVSAAALILVAGLTATWFLLVGARTDSMQALRTE
jgi:hypothetical protein